MIGSFTLGNPAELRKRPQNLKYPLSNLISSDVWLVPVIVHPCGRAAWSVAPLWDDDEVTGAKGSSGASVSCTIYAGGYCIRIAPTHVVGDHSVLYTAVACLLADAVLVVLTNQLPPSSKVVALNGT